MRDMPNDFVEQLFDESASTPKAIRRDAPGESRRAGGHQAHVAARVG